MTLPIVGPPCACPAMSFGSGAGTYRRRMAESSRRTRISSEGRTIGGTGREWGVRPGRGAVPPRAVGALVPDARFGAGRRGRRAGDAGAGVEGLGSLRPGAGIGADVGARDRHQHLLDRTRVPK